MGLIAENGIRLLVQLSGHQPKTIDTNHLVVEKPQMETGDLGERLIDSVQMALLDRAPALEVRVRDFVGENPVDHHSVYPIAEQAEIAVGAPGLVDHHLLGIDHEAGRGDLRL